MSIEDLKKALKEGKLIIGINRTTKLLKNGKINQIFIASNCKQEIKENLKYLSKISNARFSELKENNEELGAVCKKSFSISVASY